MQLESRVKRLQGLARWFNAKYASRIEPDGRVDLKRILYLVKTLKTSIVAVKPKCYWCELTIQSNDVDYEDDSLTIHHIDEDRSNNDITNLTVIHRACHQTMHKLAASAGLPALIFVTRRKANG